VLSVLNNFAIGSSIDEFTYRLAYQPPVLLRLSIFKQSDILLKGNF